MFKATNTELTDAITRYNPKLSRSSARTYASQIKSINRKFADVDFNVNMKWYDKTVEGRLLKIKKLTTKKNLLNAALIAMYVAKRTDDVKRLQHLIKPLRDELNYNQKKQKRTPREVAREIQFPVLLKKYRAFARKIPNWNVKNWPLLQKFTVLSLMILNPPVRLDYGTASMVKTKESNWIDWKAKVFNIEKFKNVKSLGPQKVPLGPALRIIKKWRAVRELINGDPNLFLTTKQKPFTSNSFGRYLSKLLSDLYGKKCSLADLRKAYVTFFNSKPRSILEKEDVAKRMLHTKSTAELFYTKLG